MFTPIKGHTVLFNSCKLNADQMELVHETIEYFDSLALNDQLPLEMLDADHAKIVNVSQAMLDRYATRQYTRQELRSANMILRNQLSTPFFM